MNNSGKNDDGTHYADSPGGYGSDRAGDKGVNQSQEQYTSSNPNQSPRSNQLLLTRGVRPQAVPKMLQSVIPAHFTSPGKLTLRLLRSRDPSAYFAMISAAATLALTPVDMLLAGIEKRTYAHSRNPDSLPTVLVVGPPRSGTTVCQQVLLGALPFGYFSNLTSLFPRSPLTMTRLLRMKNQVNPQSIASYYGKTSGIRGVNDSLYLWDRWIPQIRTQIPQSLEATRVSDMRRFFAASQHYFGKSILNKSNSILACAELVLQAMPNTYFLCLDRDPLYLAQSLYRARLDIHGYLTEPYGLRHPGFTNEIDPIKSVCLQVRFYRDLIDQQEQKVGKKRFWRVSYEDFCADPQMLVNRVATDILAIDPDGLSTTESIQNHNRSRLPAGVLTSLQDGLDDLLQDKTNAAEVSLGLAGV